MKSTFMFIMSQIDSKNIKSIINESICVDEDIFIEIRKALPKEIKIPGFTSVKKITFKSCRLMGNVIYQTKLYSGDPNIARLILKAWYINKSNIIDMVQGQLVKAGYKVSVPDFTKSTIEIESLKGEDIYTDGDNSYFRPAGEKIENHHDEDVTIAAALIGWVVLPGYLTDIDDDGLPEQEEKAVLNDLLNPGDKEQSVMPGINNIMKQDDNSNLAPEIVQSNKTSLGEMIEQLDAGFKVESKFFSELAQNLNEGILPEIGTIKNRLSSLNTKLSFIKNGLGIVDNIDLASLRESYKKYKEQNSKNESEKEIIHLIIDQVLAIRKKGKKEDYLGILHSLALDFKSVLDIPDANSKEWYKKMVNHEHYFNFLVDAIKESLNENINEDLLDKFLLRLEKEFIENLLTFYAPLANQINRSNLFFSNDFLPLPSDLENKSHEDNQPDSLKEHKVINESDITKKNIKVNEVSEAIIIPELKELKAQKSNEESIAISKKPNVKIEINNLNQEEVSVNEVSPEIKEKNLEEPTISEEENNILKLLEIDEPELAYHLAKFYEKESIELLLPSHCINNLFISLNVRKSSSQLVEKLLNNFFIYKGFTFEKTVKGYFLNKLLFATVLRPYLFAYEDLGSIIDINEIDSGYKSEFTSIKKMISEFVTQNSGILSLDRINQFASHADIVTKKENHILALSEWLKEAQSKAFRSNPRHFHSQVFNQWVNESGWIKKELDGFIKIPNSISLRKCLEKFDYDAWKKLFEKDRNNYYSSHKKDLGYDAPEADRWFKNQIDELYELLEDGAVYCNVNDDRDYKQINKTLQAFIQNITQELTNLEELIKKENQGDRLVRISNSYLLKAINNIKSALRCENENSKRLNITELENKTLLKLSFYDGDSEWTPLEYNKELADKILRYAVTPKGSLEEIVNTHFNSGNFEAIKRLYSVYDITESTVQPLESSDFVDRLKAELMNAKNIIERGCAYGFIMSENRNALISSIDIIEEKNKLSGDGINYPLSKAQIDLVLNIIDSKKEKLIKEYKNLIPENFPKEYVDILLGYLEKSSLIVFTETLERMKSGQFAVLDENDCLFKDFYQNFLKNANSNETTLITEKIRKNGVYNGIDFGKITEFQTAEALKIFPKWHSVKNNDIWQTRKNIELKSTEESFDKLKEFLEILGFESIQYKEADIYNKIIYFDFECRPIKGRAKSPLPQFGSLAEGQYRLICVNTKMTEEDFVDKVKELTPSTNRAIIVFNFFWLTYEHRLEIAKLSKKGRVSALVLDEAMLVYLLGIKGNKMSAFIKLSAPFTFAEPYQTTSSNLPEEMFYGRINQIEKLKNIHGDFSCLIYGGRQLGKTVLQRQVARIFNQPEKNYYAIYIDLRNTGIGLWNPIEKINTVLLEKFRDIPELIPEKFKENSALHVLLSKIKEWIQKKNGRILLFLDESDRFLDQDSKKEWEYLLPLKGLMEETEKRFKVIFSGLHDVRKTISIPNNPLAHFGNPICVGPMLDKEEVIEAQLLIKLPLETLGAEFESDDLVYTILGHCNWYPSLIQIFCSKLLSILYEKRSISYLPMKIKVEDVAKAYEHSRNLIKEKFNLTLSLDERYNLLANIIAFESFEDPMINIKGKAIEEIAKSAVLYWKDGFDGLNAKVEVHNLLGEMVDLGILKMLESGNVALRNQNLLGLIGDEKQILENLLNKERIVPQEFKRETSRIIYTIKAGGRELRSPFSAFYYDKLLEQESHTIVFRGSKMGGIEYVTDFLKSRRKDINLIIPIFSSYEENDSIELWKYIDSKRDNDKHNIILFETAKQYTYDDILKTNEKIINRKAVTALFLLNPLNIWHILCEESKSFDRLENQKITVFNLTQWRADVAKDWFIETGCVTAVISEIFNKLSVWHKLLDNYHENIIETPELWSEKLIEFERSLIQKGKDLYEDFGLINDNHISSIKELIEWDGSITKIEYISENDNGHTLHLRENMIDYFLSLNLIDSDLKVNQFVKKLLIHE